MENVQVDVDDQQPLINPAGEEIVPIQERNDQEGQGQGNQEEQGEQGEQAPDQGCKARCDRCCGKCIGQCQRDCSPHGIVITCIHILIFLGSLMIAVVATVNKQRNFGMCLLEAEFNADSGGYSFDRTTGVMCDYTLYYGLCSSALAFLFIMVNWVAGLHKARRWVQIQIPLNIIGLLGKLVAGAMQTVGFFIWCDHLRTATQCPHNDQSCTNRPSNRGCYNSSRIYDENRGDENRMQHFFIMVLTTMVGNWFTFILWLLSTIAVAIKLVSLPPKDKPGDDDDDDDSDMEEDEDFQPPGQGAQFGGAAAATNAGQNQPDLRQRNPVQEQDLQPAHA